MKILILEHVLQLLVLPEERKEAIHKLTQMLRQKNCSLTNFQEYNTFKEIIWLFYIFNEFSIN